MRSTIDAMTVLRQPSMFDVADELELTPLAGRVQRTELTDGAWVDHLPGWLTGSDSCSNTLLPRRALAGRAAADVRPRGRRAAAAVLVQRQPRAAASGAGPTPGPP